MDTASIARPGASIEEAEERSCGCVGSGLGIERCEEATVLWDGLIGARDALREAGHRPTKPTIDAFAEARDRYWAHLRGEAS